MFSLASCDAIRALLGRHINQIQALSHAQAQTQAQALTHTQSPALEGMPPGTCNERAGQGGSLDERDNDNDGVAVEGRDYDDDTGTGTGTALSMLS